MNIKDLLSVCDVHIPVSQIEKAINMQILKGFEYWVNSTNVTDIQEIKMCSITLAYEERKLLENYMSGVQKVMEITRENGCIIDAIYVESTDISIKMSNFLGNESIYEALRKRCSDYQEIRLD
ncbi:MAG: hypothetical protein K9L62_12870 [Vallitaleaceae bacterium]|nr:hypothetical protein [Vallitaleaceae bacterium]